MATQWLAHHGIKGQKWGIRRYQNEDGSLTQEGEKKYGAILAKNQQRANQLRERAAGVSNESEAQRLEEKATKLENKSVANIKKERAVKIGAGILAALAVGGIAFAAIKKNSNNKPRVFSEEELEKMGIAVAKIDRANLDTAKLDTAKIDFIPFPKRK